MATPIADRELGLVRHYRRALVAIPLLMAAALVTTVVIDYRNVMSVLATVERGQGEAFLHATRRALRPGPPWTTDTLTEVLTENAATGLLCIAVFEPRDHDVVVFAGDCGLDADLAVTAQHLEFGSRLRDTPPDLPVAVGARLRLTAYPPPGRRGEAGEPDRPPPRGPRHDARDARRAEGDPGGAGPGPGDDDRGPGDEDRGPGDEDRGPGDEDRGPGAWRRFADRRELGRRPLGGRRGGPEALPILIEYEARQTAALERGAQRTLAVGGAVSFVLLLAAVALLQAGRRAEHDRAQRERERRLASLGEMSAVLAHEIRNPLASMKGHAQLLAERLETGGRDHEKAERVVYEIGRLESLTNDLLDFVRSPHLERSKVVPAELLKEAAESVGGGIELDVARSPARWNLDGERMRQVLVNLLANAVQASPPGHPSRAAVEVKGGELVFTVRDRGAGIAAADRERIFEPFHTTRVRGTGLGLAVAERIVKLHGGTITADNHPDGGAVFRVRIPAAAS